MKKIIFALAAGALLLSSCCQVKQPVKIADYIWEITVDEYPTEGPMSEIDKATSEFGCTAVRNGNFYGRNLDFFISEVAEFVVHTTAKEGRHASVGVSRLYQFTDEDIAKGLTKEQIGLIPWGMFDGINDAGLFCNMNVTPSADSGIPHTDPAPGLPKVSCVFLVRALLDNCATVEDAIEFVNTHSVIGMDKGGFDLHFMIGDPNRTVVLEYIDNKAVIMDQNIMTNFLVNVPELTPHADGIERYEIIKEHFDEGATMEGMWNLLRRVKFTQAYDPTLVPFWKSEFCGEEGRTIATPVEEILAGEADQKAFADMKNYLETGYYTPEMRLWYTTHNSTYDIANKTLWLTIRENYEKRYEFSL